MTNKIGETKRTSIRELVLSDLDDLYALYAEEGITDYVGPLFEREMEEAYQKLYIENMYRGLGYGMWLIFDKQTDALIGRGGLERRIVNGKSLLELGIIISARRQRSGLAKEVCTFLIDYAKKNTEDATLYSFTEKENAASAAMLKSLGFAYSGQIQIKEMIFDKYIYALKG